MRSTVTSYQARRHPFLAGIALLLVGPYILGFVLVFAVLYVIAVGLDALGGRR